ncbi:hypothetical protein DFH07DRAFT_965938 [Mycena maculata]|uniref:Uncharacterized protein n=1 Tax=Mycena maculata TaxID=230809 RepID=A0AAD7MZ57_9AGAR|nr:hypothetical protein DFH07DRAFT_965938 [Mycena maculata]
MGKRYLCTCALRDNAHLVSFADRKDHEKELADKKSREELNRTLDKAVNDLGALTLKDPSDLSLDSAADLLAALTLTDSGPDISRQPSKLWTPRSEFQEIRALHHPVSFAPLGLEEANRSVQAVVADLPKRIDKVATRRQNIQNEIKKQLSDAKKTLDVAENFDMENDQQLAAMRSRLRSAFETSMSVEESLKHIKDSPQKADLAAELRGLEIKINFVGSVLPPETTPLPYDASHIAENPVRGVGLIAQVMMLLGIVCHVIMGLGTDPTNFVLQTVTLIIKMVMSLHAVKTADGKEEYDAGQKDILGELPTTLYTAMKRFNLDGKTMQYAMCPSCHHTHPPLNPAAAVLTYPETCVNRVVDNLGARTCSTPLLVKRDGRMRPICSFLSASFIDHVARILSDPEIERMCDKACDDAMAALKQAPNPYSTSVFESEFMKTFEGPVPGQLFIDRGTRMRLPYALFLDFFNPNGTRKRGNHDSIGLLSAVNMALPHTIRNKPEYVHVNILLGRKEPDVEQINGHLIPTIDDALIAWERGINITPTGASPKGRDVDIAFVLSINDLPAARKLAGAAGHTSHFFCTVCSCHGIPTMYRSDFGHQDWQPRDVNELRNAAFAWRDATNLKERDRIFKKYGVRWSEMWRLPYWNPSRMLVIDAMHCILEGLVHYYCRHVLQIDVEEAKRPEKPPPAYDHDFVMYDEDEEEVEEVPFRMRNGRERKQVGAIHTLLVLPLEGESAKLRDKATFIKKLAAKNKSPLQFVCWTLDLLDSTHTEKETKAQLAEKLYQWRLTKPLVSASYAFRPKTMPPESVAFIQEVIRNTVTPSWINSVPKDFGSKKAGTIKADEWRLYATIFLPIALVLMWGDNMTGPHAAHFESLLTHSMALFQATTLVCRYTMSKERASAFRTFLKDWLDRLHPLFPHTGYEDRKKRPNIHAAFHIYDFLLLFGPIKTNNHIGGETEATMLTSFMRGANLRRWLNRPDCPQVILEFKRLFDLAFTRRNFRDEGDVPEPGANCEPARYRYKGLIYSRASTDLGGSLVMYYPPDSTSATAGKLLQRTLDVDLMPSMPGNPSVPANGPLFGGACIGGEFYTVYQGDPRFLCHFPSPEEAASVDTQDVYANFTTPTYMSNGVPYIPFIPKFCPWYGDLLGILGHYTWGNTPIMKVKSGQWAFASAPASQWYELEEKLQCVAQALLEGEQTPFDEIVAAIISFSLPMPLYIRWGKIVGDPEIPIPRLLSAMSLIPSMAEQTYMRSLPGSVKWSPWAWTIKEHPNPGSDHHSPWVAFYDLVQEMTFRSLREEQPFSAPPAAPELPPEPEPAPAPVKPFPPVEKNSGQRPEETMVSFLARRKSMRERAMANEDSKQKLRREQLEKNASTGAVPGKRGARVYVWELRDGYYIRTAGGRDKYEDIWEDYSESQRMYDSNANEWDVCEAFGTNQDEEDLRPYTVIDYDTEFDDEPLMMGPDTMRSDMPADLSTPIVNLAPVLPAADTDPDLPPNPVAAKVLGDKDIALPSAGKLETYLTFLAQCRDFKSAQDIDHIPIDFHDPESTLNEKWEVDVQRVSCIADGASFKGGLRYVIRETDNPSGLCLVLESATTVLEVIRRKWGPTVIQVAQHLLARGMAFHFGLPLHPTPLAPTTSSRLTYSGLGYRSQDYQPDVWDFRGYMGRRRQLLHSPRGLVALRSGGVIARIARDDVCLEDGLICPSDYPPDHGVCFWDGRSAESLRDEQLTDDEVDIICGVYHVATGQWDPASAGNRQITSRSWWPRPHSFAKSALNVGWWTPACEHFYQGRLQKFDDGIYRIETAHTWKEQLKLERKCQPITEAFPYTDCGLLLTTTTDSARRIIAVQDDEHTAWRITAVQPFDFKTPGLG